MTKKLFTKKKHTSNRITQFLRLFKKNRSDKKKIRELEMKLLRPDPIPEYKGPKATGKQFQKKSIIVAFQNSKYIEQWAKHFRVANYMNNNTWDTDFLIEIFRLLDSGRLTWDPKKKKFKLHMKNRKLTL